MQQKKADPPSTARHTPTPLFSPELLAAVTKKLPGLSRARLTRDWKSASPAERGGFEAWLQRKERGDSAALSQGRGNLVALLAKEGRLEGALDYIAFALDSCRAAPGATILATRPGLGADAGLGRFSKWDAAQAPIRARRAERDVPHRAAQVRRCGAGAPLPVLSLSGRADPNQHGSNLEVSVAGGDLF
jgi:hypothetical protein